MIQRGGHPVLGFGVGAILTPASVNFTPLIASGAGLAAVIVAKKFGAPTKGIIASGIGASLVAGVAAQVLSRPKAIPRRRFMTDRGSSMSTTGGFTSQVQQALTNAGFDTQGIDGTWGSHTSTAASAFQSAHGMTPTGLPEPELLQALGVAIPAYPNAADIATALDGISHVAAPRDALKIMLGESGLNPASVAYKDSKPVAGGVFGLLVSQTQNLTGMSFDDWIRLSAAQQIPYAVKFWKGLTSRFGASFPVSARDLYWLNYLPATYVAGAADDYVFVKSDDTYLPKGGSWTYSAGFYTQNESLDHPLTPGGPKKGYITAGDMAEAAKRGAMNSPATYAAVTAALSASNVS